MDLVDDGAATSTGDNKRRVHEKNRDWHKRLHLRKAAAQPPAMQSRDKRGPKTTAGERGGSQKPPRGGAAFGTGGGGGRALRFTCSQCQDGAEYVPKDLVRHFEEKHRGSPPVFPCRSCPFTTHEFSYLQVHLLSHEDNFSSCSMCGDSVPRTWPEFAAHLTTYHCSNGKYLCKICQNFSTGDVRVFLEHICLHNLNLDGANDGLLHLKEKKPFGPEAATQTFRCQHCGYEASQKWLMTKHIKAVHACQNGNQRTKKKKSLSVRSIAAMPSDVVPKTKPRLTRSAVREMCWLTQDCLSLPGREFLDKYCHLSDPQATLEETQQFLMKSVAGETGDQKWTKALKTVLSNVPQDVALYAKAENGAAPNSSDLTVLTVKNKITVGQNGATYAKRLKMVAAASDREAAAPGSAAVEVHLNGDQSSLSDHAPRTQVEIKPLVDVAASGAAEPGGGVLTQENRENQEVKTEQKHEDHSRKLEGPVPSEGIHSGCDARLTQESAEMSCVHKALPKIKRPNRRRRRKARFKRVDKRSTGLPLKIVLKKNPAEKQWVSQSSLSPSGGDAADGPDKVHIPPSEEQTVCGMQPARVQQQKWTKGCQPDLPSQAISSAPQSKPGEESVGSKNTSPNWPGGSPPSPRQEMRADMKKSESEADRSGSSGQTGRPHPRAAADAETPAEDGGLQTARCGDGSQVTEEEEEEEGEEEGEEGSAADGATPHSSESSPVSQPVITPQDEVSVEGSSLVPPAEQGDRSAQRTQNGDVPADSRHPPAATAGQQEPSPAASACRRSHPAPKTKERTLKLVATNRAQLVKRPAGDQPVVVLNHPDAEIPEVARIMEVVNRYRGEVNKVILSRRTLRALSALSGETAQTDDLLEPERRARDRVQERFTLKFKFRRLSRKKYEIVDAVSLSREEDDDGGAAPAAASKFRCWFCGRVFTSREAWMSHRQRHLMEWKL